MTTANDNKELVPVIDQNKDLTHLNELVTEITDMKEGYKDLKIEGPEDKDGYKQVQAAIGKLRPKRTGLEAERKSVVKPYNDFVKHINSEYEKITDLILDGPGGETELKGKKEVIDTILEKQKEEEDRLKEQKINDRINDLIKNGMVFDGNYYSISAPELQIAETSIGVVEIRTMSDELFKQFLDIVAEKAQKITTEKERVAELERKQKVEKDLREQKEREEFDRRKKLLDEQEKKLKEQQDKLKDQQDKIDQENRDRERDRINGIIRHRSGVLVGMGLEHNGKNNSYDYNSEVVVNSADKISDYDDAAWLNLIETLKSTIAQKKIDAENLLKQKQQEEKERQEQQEKERQAGLNDKQKMKEYTDALKAVPVPQLTTKTWKTKAGAIRDVIADNSPA